MTISGAADQSTTLQPLSLDNNTDHSETFLGSFTAPLAVAVIGASGGIGSALSNQIVLHAPSSTVHKLSRHPGQIALRDHFSTHIDLEDETSIAEAAEHVAAQTCTLDAIFVASGLLHNGELLQPEKSLNSIRKTSLELLYRVNAVGPALVAKHFLPLLKRDSKSVFACLSARVGSISDNRAGGWYGYRAAKAALNMIIKSIAIELARQNPSAICVGLHPGTVDTALSKPFQGNVPKDKLFSVDRSASALLAVVDGLTKVDSGKCFAWDGQVIPF